MHATLPQPKRKRLEGMKCVEREKEKDRDRQSQTEPLLTSNGNFLFLYACFIHNILVGSLCVARMIAWLCVCVPLDIPITRFGLSNLRKPYLWFASPFHVNANANAVTLLLANFCKMHEWKWIAAYAFIGGLWRWQNVFDASAGKRLVNWNIKNTFRVRLHLWILKIIDGFAWKRFKCCSQFYTVQRSHTLNFFKLNRTTAYK